MDNLPEQRSRKPAIAILAVLLLVVTLATWMWIGISPEQRAMESLATFVLETGDVGPIVAEGAAYFDIPADDLRFHHLDAKSQNGQSKSIQVRKRADTGHVDIFFVDLLPSAAAGYFYLTSTHGQLIQAAYLDPEPQLIDDAAERFKQEIEFWKLWQREKEAQVGG